LFDTLGYVSTDNFDPLWIAPDYALLCAFHAFIGLLDFNDDGRINSDDNPFEGLNLVITADTVIIEGLDSLLNNPQWRDRWVANALESIDEAGAGARVFIETFGDSSATYGEVDSLLADLKTTLTASSQ
jgi:hypothetical protein